MSTGKDAWRRLRKATIWLGLSGLARIFLIGLVALIPPLRDFGVAISGGPTLLTYKSFPTQERWTKKTGTMPRRGVDYLKPHPTSDVSMIRARSLMAGVAGSSPHGAGTTTRMTRQRWQLLPRR